MISTRPRFSSRWAAGRLAETPCLFTNGLPVQAQWRTHSDTQYSNYTCAFMRWPGTGWNPIRFLTVEALSMGYLLAGYMSYHSSSSSVVATNVGPRLSCGGRWLRGGSWRDYKMKSRAVDLVKVRKHGTAIVLNQLLCLPGAVEVRAAVPSASDIGYARIFVTSLSLLRSPGICIIAGIWFICQNSAFANRRRAR